jgi:acyl-homoserine-lactone acylase
MPPSPFRSGGCGMPDKSGKSFIQSGESHPQLMVMGAPIESWSAAPFGQSDDPKSPHFADQSVLYSEHRLKPTYFNKGELKGHVESTRTLTWNGS